MTRVKAQQT